MNETTKTKRPTVTEARNAAISAARSYLRQQHVDPKTASLLDYQSALDDLLRVDCDTIAAQYYAFCTHREWTRFCNEVARWQREQNS